MALIIKKAPKKYQQPLTILQPDLKVKHNIDCLSFPLVCHFVQYVTYLAVLRETSVLEGTAVKTHNSIKMLRKVVSRGRVVLGNQDYIKRALQTNLPLSSFN